ncbi:class I SAM-dependent methyltransferase [Conexibacter woesei]|uniref:class I SAM-dependent methyltransferase n=1 Tax=Conexibacter woesei TaxID=191495 RepID=UPI00041A2045|nr:class I SAM-dependent methyltransferase [Conexibacter woesei]
MAGSDDDIWDLPLGGLVDDGAVLAVIEEHAELDPLRPGWDLRLAYELQLAELYRDVERWVVPGFCHICRRLTPMFCDWVSAWGGTPNYRERLHCRNCGLNNRQRFTGELLRRLGAPPYYLFETVTGFYTWAKATLPEVTGSEYLGHDIPGGTIVQGLRHEDALNLSFADDSYGTIVSCDVFEHVADIDRALAECVRVLRRDGVLLLSVPFTPDQPTTVKRAELGPGGEVIHLEEPNYHGNPLDQERGSLTFYDHGWDLVDRMRAAGFRDVGVVAYWSQLHGHLGRGLQFQLLARK